MKAGESLRTSGTAAERLLLGAGSAEKPGAESVGRAAAALGLAPKALVAGGVLATVLRYWRWTSRWSRIAFGAGGFGAVALVTYVAGGGAIGTSPAVTPAPRASARIEVPAPPSAGGIGMAEPVAPGTADAMRPPALRPIAAARPTARTAPPSDTLGEQTQKLDRARASLEAGELASALAGLDEFDRRFPGTPLAEESAALRIEALARRGDREGAGRAARQFLKRYPASVHVARVTELLRSLSP